MSPTLMELTDDERTYITKRLDQEHISELAQKINMTLEQGNAVEACYQPGDGTWYALVFARCVLLGASGGGTQGNQPSSQIGRDRVFVAYLQRGTHSSFEPGMDDPEWIAGKLTDNGASAVAIAELLRNVNDERDS